MPGKQRKRQGNSDTSRSPRRNQRKPAMPKRSGHSSDSTRSMGAVGSDPKAAAKVGGKGDFGVPETGRERDRAYVSQETKSQDPGALPGHSSGEGQRVAGVGGND